MRIRNLIFIGGLLLVAGCGQGADKSARTVGESAAPGGTAAAPGAAEVLRGPAGPPPPRKVDCDRLKCVALTFDDGPGPYTGRLLDTLKAGGVRATFFMVGQNVPYHRDVVRRMPLDGHEVANHTWSHRDLTELSTAGVRSQIRRTQEVIEDASGVEPTLMRPPYGATNGRVGRAVGMPQIMWSVDTQDWRYRSVSRGARVGINQPERGDIVLYHDIHKSSVDCIPKVVDGLRKRGFTFVTVSELFRGDRLEPGEIYTEGTLEAELVTASPPPAGSTAGPPR
ncbi:polysaccharide deacetylase family protein [Spirillospora sp. NPDC048819]|uniref:polysaccharide deacetylase family protein n=1 Tax=Spirillospora sp. NPDC048819 TaxID=3155268 RepID=UPI0033CE1C82